MSTRSITSLMLGTLLSLPAVASDGGQLAADHGCMNCHGPTAKAAPSLQSLGAKLQRKGESPEALQHLLKEMREGKKIQGHQMVSDESALAILAWMARGSR
ncbi:MAG: c-type cytochrome [Burkholderiaceae bacterium]|nr:c-type cytochrome [Burkholderiaceae bacterium]